MLPGPTFKDSDLIGAGCGLGISIFKVSWESIICRRENQFHCILCAFRPMDYASGCPVINRSSPLFSKMYKERGKQAGLPRVVIYCGKSVEIWGQVDLDLSLGQPLTKLCNYLHWRPQNSMSCGTQSTRQKGWAWIKGDAILKLPWLLKQVIDSSVAFPHIQSQQGVSNAQLVGPKESVTRVFK